MVVWWRTSWVSGMLITWACIVVGAYYFCGLQLAISRAVCCLSGGDGANRYCSHAAQHSAQIFVRQHLALGRASDWSHWRSVCRSRLRIHCFRPIGRCVLSALGLTLAIGLGLGIIGGLIAKMLKGHWVPHYLRNVAVLTLMLAAFSFLMIWVKSLAY